VRPGWERARLEVILGSMSRRFQRWLERVLLGAMMTVAAWAAERWFLRMIERRRV
jgi:hypothetical protein